MAYQETTTIGYGSRLKNSFGGIATGFLMFVAGTCLIWWNEGRAVKTDKMLKEAEKVAVHVDNIDNLDASLEGQLIHANGMATTTDTLRDEAFGVKANAIHLQRRVEFYQWVEHTKQESKDKLGGKEEIVTTYTYSKQWVSQPVNSSSFKDPAYQNVKNGAVIQAENASLTSENVTFGAYTLPAFMVNSIGGMQAAEVAPTEQQLREWDQQISRVQRQFGRATITDEMTSKIAHEVTDAVNNVTQKAIAAINGDSTLTAEQKALAIDSIRRDSIAMATKTEPAKVGNYTATYVHVGNGKLYFGLNEGAPEVGDVRITFTMTPPTKISLMGVVQGNTFANYTAKNGKKFSAVSNGVKTMDEMFASQHEANNMWLWALRLVGLLLIISGLKGIFGILVTILKVVPFLSSILSFGINIICSVVGFVWALLVAAIAWIFYRPVIGIALLAIAGAVIFFFWKKGKDKNAATPAAPAPNQPAQP
jgi:hypothetical protein